MSKTIAFKTLGCRLNQYETEAMASEIENRGFRVVDFKSSADAYVVNTCTVTGQSDQKSKYYINSAAKREHKPLVLVTGCMANNHADRLNEDSSITYLIKNEHKTQIPEIIEAHYKGEIFNADYLKPDNFGYGAARQVFHTRSMIKIQDGCDNMCSFCIIPHVRGRAVSRPPEDIIRNIRNNIENGFKEIVITGVNIGRYKHNNINFEDLIEQILEIPENFRLRISSLEPDGFSDRFRTLFQHPKLMPHLHLCLQSGSDKVLMRMRRMYSTDQFRSVVESFRRDYPLFNFTTDVIVGFPGETEEDFLRTIDMVKKLEFSHVHTFKFSGRKGTSAFRSPEQISEADKSARSLQLRDLSSQLHKKYLRKFIGLKEEILTETLLQDGSKGYGRHYTPILLKNVAEKNLIKQTTIEELQIINNEPILIGK